MEIALPRSLNVADAKRHLSELLGRVAFAGETIVITRRGKPMAKLVPATETETPSLADVKGWLKDDDPWFQTIDEIVAARSTHTPRVLRESSARGRKPVR